MSQYIRIFIMILFAGLLVSFLTVYGIFLNQDEILVNNLHDAVQTSLYKARDDSARVKYGTFIINRDKFQKTLENTAVKSFKGEKPVYHISYLKDTDNSDSDIPDKGATYTVNTPTKDTRGSNVAVATEMPVGSKQKTYEQIAAVKVETVFNTKNKQVSAKDDDHSVTYVISPSVANNPKDSVNVKKK